MDRGRIQGVQDARPVGRERAALLVALSAANTHDSRPLKPMVLGHQTRHDPHCGRHFTPQRLHADKAYDVPRMLKWVRGKRIGVRIARKCIEPNKRLGLRRWVIKRIMSWLKATADSTPFVRQGTHPCCRPPPRRRPGT